MAEQKAPKMYYNNLGRTGLKVSVLSYGAWVTFGNEDFFDTAYELMKTAYDNGVNFFDNAEAYNGGAAETMMGKVFKKAGWNRKDYVVSTKIFWGGRGPNDTGLSRKHIIEGVDNSLKRLQLDYVDVIFCHRPDPETPIEETVRAMDWVINRGKAFYWGTSEWSAQQITEASEIAKRLGLIGPVVEQPQYNLLHRERFEVEYAPLYENIGLGTTIWSPLAMGLLTGKYNNGIPAGSRFDGATFPYQWLKALKSDEGKEIVAKLNKLADIGKGIGCSLAQLAIVWCMKNKHVSTVILGASKVEQLKENLAALKYVDKLTPAMIEEIEKIVGTKPEQPRNWRG